VPIAVAEKRGTRVVGSDEHPRPGTTVEALAKLRPAFQARTTGRRRPAALGVNDAAAAIVVMSSLKGPGAGLEFFRTAKSHAGALAVARSFR